MSRKILSLFTILFIISAILPLVYADQTVFGPKDLKIGRWHVHLSSHQFSVDDPSDGVLTIVKNTPDKEIKGGFCFLNGKYIGLRNFLKGTGTFFEKDVNLRSNNRITVFLRGTHEASIKIEIKKKGITSPPKVTFTAASQAITHRELSTLTWTTTNAESVIIDQGIGSVSISGSHAVLPTETTIYTITATGPGGTATDSAEIVVIAPPEDIDYGLNDNEQQEGGGLVGKTIRILNGNNLEYRSDLLFPSPNRLGLSIQAFYNSRSSFHGSLGYGWLHIYEVSLDPSFEMEGKSFIKIIDYTGRASYFLEEEDGDYKGAFKELTYVKAEAGDYIWYRLDGTRYVFSALGKLTRIEDEKGNRLELTYDSNDRPETVTDTSSGRILSFYYNAGGLLEYISGPVTDAVSDGIWVTYGYDGNQNLTSVTYPDGSGFNYTYSDQADVHNLTETRDKSNHFLNTWIYDTQDRAINNFDAEGNGVSINYIGVNQVAVTDAYGTLRTYTMVDIDGRKRVTAMNGPASTPYTNSNAVRWVYDDHMRLVEVEYAGGAINQYRDYNEMGNPQTVTLAVGTPEEKVITYTYHPEMNVKLRSTEASVLRSGDKVTIWDYDDDYDATPNEEPTRLISRIIEKGFTKDTSGAVAIYDYITSFTYNTKGQVLNIDGPLPENGDITSYTYNPATGDLLSTTMPLVGSIILSNYDTTGRPGRVTDVNGQSKSFSYDGRGRTTAITNDAEGSTTVFTYNIDGKLASETDPDGIKRTFTYDTVYGRRIRVTDPEGNYIAYDYDAQGNRTEMSYHDTSGTRTFRKRWSYQHPNIPGKLWKVINPDGNYTEYGYDNTGNIVSMTDYAGNTTTYEYDHRNRLIRVTQPGNVITSYSYNTQGKLSVVTDAEGHGTVYEYDDLGRTTSTTSSDTGTVTYVYDEAGNLVRKTDSNGISVDRTYDTLNRLTAAHFPDPNQDITYTYDTGTYGIGRLAGITNQAGIITFSYDNRGRLIEKASAINGHNFIVTHAYTPGNRLNAVTYPTGRSVTYSRNSLGKIAGVSTTYNGNTATLLNNITYLPFGPSAGMDMGGSSVNNVFDERYHMTVANPGAETERSYGYDANGNITSISITNQSWKNQNFTYDALNQIIEAGGPYGTISYTYDNVGNRLTRTVDDQTETYTYISGTNKLNEIAGPNPATFEYDANGNTTAIGKNTFVYNQNNRLIRSEENGNILGEYKYSGLGQRVIKQADSVTTIFHYDLNGNLIAESLSDGTFTSEYLYMGKSRIAKVNSSGNSIYYYLNDHLGTPQIMTNASGTVVWEGIYKPFGEADVNPNSSMVNNFRLPGQIFDEETGLHYNWHRDYDPTLGRYLRVDPIGLAGGINLFTYCLNDPVNLIDPEGLSWLGPIKWVGKQLLKRIGKKFGTKIGETKIAYPPAQQEMDKDTDGDGLSDFFDPDDDNDGIPDERDADFGPSLWPDEISYPPGWFPEFQYNPDNPEEIDRNSSVNISVIGGAAPYTWSVSGNGFSLSQNETEGLSNTLYANNNACGPAIITVTDAGSETVEGVVRCSVGHWVEIHKYCCISGSIQTCPAGYEPDTEVGVVAPNFVGKYMYCPGYVYYGSCPKSSYPYPPLCYENIPPFQNIVPCSKSIPELNWSLLGLSGYLVYEWQCEE